MSSRKDVGEKSGVCRVLLTRSMLPGDLEYIRTGLDRTVPNRYELIVPEQYDENSLCAHAANANVFLGPFISEHLLQSAPELQLIQVPWTGMDTFPFAAVQHSDVPICNTHSNADSVAELALALALDLTKKLSYHDRKMRQGNWNRDQKPLSLRSAMLKDSTICVLGLGNIGSRIATLFKAFGASVVGTSNRCHADGNVDQVFPQSKLMEAAAHADLIVCALPLTTETRGLLNRHFFEVVRPGSMLVNVSRAAVIDEDALYDALISEKLAGFAADVWWCAPKRGESESWPSERHPFHKLEQVVMSPHRAGFVENSLPHLDGAVENISALILGKPLQNLVDRHREY